MSKQHKHAELIKAWADGAEIQWYGEVREAWFNCDNPLWDEDTKYRIKPEPKPDIVKKWEVSSHNTVWFYRDDPTKPPFSPNIRLTFDGETGDLKAAEVIKNE